MKGEKDYVSDYDTVYTDVKVSSRVTRRILSA